MLGIVAGKSRKEAWMRPPHVMVAEWEVLSVQKKARRSLDWVIASYFEPVFRHEIYHPQLAYYAGSPRVFAHLHDVHSILLLMQ